MASLSTAKGLADRIRYKEDIRLVDEQDSFKSSAHKDSMLRHGILISSSLTPVLEERICSVCDSLHIPRSCVSAFVHNDPQVQADCFVESSSSCVLRFSSGLINLMDSDEFKFVAAHELGHFLLNHGACKQYRNKSTAQDFIISRAKEISADRIGFLGTGNLEKSLQAIIKTASGLGNEFLRFDIASFVSQADLLSKPERGEAIDSTHPSMLIRCRALLWFSMKINTFEDNVDDDIQTIDNRVEKDLERFVDGAVRSKKRDVVEDIILWKSCELIVHSGSFSKDTQQRMSQLLGPNSVESVKSFFELFTAQELQVEVSSKLHTSLSILNENFPSSAQELEDEAFAKAYSILNN